MMSPPYMLLSPLHILTLCNMNTMGYLHWFSGFLHAPAHWMGSALSVLPFRPLEVSLPGFLFLWFFSPANKAHLHKLTTTCLLFSSLCCSACFLGSTWKESIPLPCRLPAEHLPRARSRRSPPAAMEVLPTLSAGRRYSCACFTAPHLPRECHSRMHCRYAPMLPFCWVSFCTGLPYLCATWTLSRIFSRWHLINTGTITCTAACLYAHTYYVLDSTCLHTCGHMVSAATACTTLYTWHACTTPCGSLPVLS